MRDISKLKFIENHGKPDVSENSQAVYDFLQNELYADNSYVSKIKLDVQFVKSTIRSSILKGKCKGKDLKRLYSFYIYLLTSCFWLHFSQFNDNYWPPNGYRSITKVERT